MAARKATVKKPVEKMAGVLQLRTDEVPSEFAEREPLFYLDDVEYTVPVKFPASVALEYMYLFRTQGFQDAYEFALAEGLGEDGYRALRKYKGLTPEQVGSVFKVIKAKIDESASDPKFVTGR